MTTVLIDDSNNNQTKLKPSLSIRSSKNPYEVPFYTLYLFDFIKQEIK